MYVCVHVRACVRACIGEERICMYVDVDLFLCLDPSKQRVRQRAYVSLPY